MVGRSMGEALAAWRFTRQELVVESFVYFIIGIREVPCVTATAIALVQNEL